MLLLTYCCPPLAYGLDRAGKCARLGGSRVCGDCIKDLDGPILRFVPAPFDPNQWLEVAP